MTEYRRANVPGATWFFTVNLAHRRDNSLLIDEIVRLRAALARVRRTHPFTIDAMVAMPGHLHSMWTLPLGDSDYATRWSLIKSIFPRGLPQGEWRSASRIARGERGVWQRRCREHMVRDGIDFARHADYIHFNPVKHGWAREPRLWPHSSFRRFVERGVYPADWGGEGCPDEWDAGE